MERFIDILRQSLLKTDVTIPVDLTTVLNAGDITSLQRMGRKRVTAAVGEEYGILQNILYMFGRLLNLWPEIYGAMDQFDRDEMMRYVSLP